MVSPEDIQSVVVDEDTEQFTIIRNSGKTQSYSIYGEYNFFLMVMGWAEEGSIEGYNIERLIE